MIAEIPSYAKGQKPCPVRAHVPRGEQLVSREYGITVGFELDDGECSEPSA